MRARHVDPGKTLTAYLQLVDDRNSNPELKLDVSRQRTSLVKEKALHFSFLSKREWTHINQSGLGGSHGNLNTECLM